MGYTYEIGGEKLTCDSNAHGILGQIGVDITERDGRVTVDFSGRNEMNALACQGYTNPCSGLMGTFNNASGNNTVTFKSTPEFGYREISAAIAGRALQVDDKLGADFADKVRELSTPVQPSGPGVPFQPLAGH